MNEQYRYDALLRLTNSTIANGAVNSTFWYQYDSAGNRINRCCVALTNSSFSPTNNELLQTSRRISPGHYATSASYAYDSDGSLKSANITSLAPLAHWSYVWSPQGNLLRVSNYTSIQGLYAYDGLGRRVEAKEGSSTTFYAYEGTDTLAEIVPGAPSPDYVYANGIRIARTGGTVSTTYYITDALGSTRVVTDTSGRVVVSDNYQPFGSDNTSKGSETYKFTGKPVSQTTGLYYEYSRWYDPSIGRFISQDQFAGSLSDPQSLNPYVYVQDTPTTFVDPSGMSIAPPNPNLHGSNCPAIWQSSFWSNPLGSIECDFGVETLMGGGQGGCGRVGPGIDAADSPSPAGAIVAAIAWGLWGLSELYSHRDEWFGDHVGGTTSPGGSTGNGGTTTPGVGGLTSDLGTPFVDMGRGPPDKNPDYDREKFPRPGPGGGPVPGGVRSEFGSKRVPRWVCGTLALSLGISVTAMFGAQVANQRGKDFTRGEALAGIFLGATLGSYALCASI